MDALVFAVLATAGAAFAGALLELGARPVTEETDKEAELRQGNRLFIAMIVCLGVAAAILLSGGTK